MSTLVQEWLLKRRIVLEMRRPAYAQRPTAGPRYTVKRFDSITWGCHEQELAYRLMATHLGESRLRSRLNHRDCAAFIAIENATGEPVGYYWGVVSAVPNIWHDKFPIPTGCGLAFNAYVLETHRRRGIYALLQGAVHNYLFDDRECEAVYTIVESANLASICANTQFGLTPVFTNYLIKFLRRNLFSVYWSKRGCKVYLVARGIASNSL